jgi:uncharacterized protein YgbK (DUF1537 family)
MIRSLGVLADDVTGGSDVASVLRRAGVAVLQTIGVPRAPLPDADAVVVSLKTRTVTRDAAAAESIAAVSFLCSAGADQIYFKYGSTFDSTEQGNIGPVIEALLAHLDAEMTVACPAYPALGRTIYQGHLFVNDVLLSESSMRHHPLTPMTDANLVRVLGRQCRRPIGLVRLSDVEQGAASIRARLDGLRREGCVAAIVDSVFDRHLDTVGEACVDLRLVTGGAALAGSLARARSTGARSDAPPPLPPRVGPAAVLSGSCSAATRAQVAFAAAHLPSAALDPIALSNGRDGVAKVIDWACAQARRGDVLLYSTASADSVQDAQARLGKDHATAVVEETFARVAAALAGEGVRTFVVAGGETAASVVHALGVRVLRFGDEIDPGVPWTYSLDPEGFSLALKSGNFGTPDFFLKAIRMGGADERNPVP